MTFVISFVSYLFFLLSYSEDRMLSTQMIINGWMLQYCSDAVAYTFCPDSMADFFVQRR